MELPLAVGDLVLLSEPFGPRGLGRFGGIVQRQGQPFLQIALEDAGKTVLVPADCAHTLGRPMTAAEADVIVQAFSSPESMAPDERDFEQQTLDTMKSLIRGSWLDIQWALARLYAFAWKPAFGQLRLMDLCETTLLPILAHALGKKVDALRTELRAGRRAFTATQPRGPAPFVEPTLSPDLDDESYEAMFPLEVTGELSFCDSPGAPEMPNPDIARIAVAPGSWHSYARRIDGGSELFLVHASRLGEGTRGLADAPWTQAAEIVRTVGTGMINVLDRAAIDDAWTLDRMLYLPGERAHRGRALTIGTEGWEGPLPIFVAGDVPDRIKIAVTHG